MRDSSSLFLFYFSASPAKLAADQHLLLLYLQLITRLVLWYSSGDLVQIYQYLLMKDILSHCPNVTAKQCQLNLASW
jgi:hypothetical protein